MIAVAVAAAVAAVLAVIGDGLPEPAEARYRFRVLDGRVGAVVRVFEGDGDVVEGLLAAAEAHEEIEIFALQLRRDRA